MEDEIYYTAHALRDSIILLCCMESGVDNIEKGRVLKYLRILKGMYASTKNNDIGNLLDLSERYVNYFIWGKPFEPDDKVD